MMRQAMLMSLLSGVVLAGCSNSGRTGAPGTGGTGVIGTGGTPGSGGAVAASGGTGAGTGGALSTGGSGSGGVAGTGGNGSTGSGGAASTGGATATGGGAGGGGKAGGQGGATTAGGCGAAGLLFCDDFEAGTAGMPPAAPRWKTAFNGSATITVDGTTPAHSGSKSVHVKTTGSYQAFFVLSDAVTFPARVYFRTYMRLGAPMSSGHNTYFKSGAAATASSDHETRVGVMNAMLMINQPAADRGVLSNKNYYSDGNKPGVVFTPQTWVCVEVLADPAKSEIDLWVDGKEVPDLHLTDWMQDPIGALRFGFEKYAGPDVDLWYDDIAVSGQPIGCN